MEKRFHTTNGAKQAGADMAARRAERFTTLRPDEIKSAGA
jgi:hypothetical protein